MVKILTGNITFFAVPVDNLVWKNYLNITVDASPSLSSQAIYQVFSNMDKLYLFKILYALLFSFSPLVVYSISKKKIGAYFAFFRSSIFISFYNFFQTNNGPILLCYFSGYFSLFCLLKILIKSLSLCY